MKDFFDPNEYWYEFTAEDSKTGKEIFKLYIYPKTIFYVILFISITYLII